jgi:hypothetical protein
MKKTLVTLAAVMISYCSYAQNNTFPLSGYAGVGTTSPGSPFTVVGSNGYSSPGTTVVFSSTFGMTSSSVGNQLNITNSPTSWAITCKWRWRS